MAKRPRNGITWKKGNDDVTVPEFSVPADAVAGIAQVIVNAWTNAAATNLDLIMERNNGLATQNAWTQATNAINAAAPNFNLTRAVIISEKEHDEGYKTETENEVVFVLPNKERADLTGANLLNTAKLLMACTPNGI